jgi:hypothetical protein
MKTLLLIAFPLFILKFNSKDLPQDLSKEDKQFVKNVIKLSTEEVVDVSKTNDSTVVITFEQSIYELDLYKGFVRELWILEGQDWVSLGPEY